MRTVVLDWLFEITSIHLQLKIETYLLSVSLFDSYFSKYNDIKKFVPLKASSNIDVVGTKYN